MCPVTCGGADQTRTRTITTMPMNEGQACGTNSMETRRCNENICPGREIDQHFFGSAITTITS